MSEIKSYSFPDGEIRGDMFFIKHNNDTFSLIDCYLKPEGTTNGRMDEILTEVQRESRGRICRFISTHPDQDHIAGLEKLDAVWPITNFYSVPNAMPEESGNESLSKYIELRSSEHNFSINRDIKRAWLNDSAEGRNGGGINFLWPLLENDKFKEAQAAILNGGKVNNICPIFTYSLQNGATVMWMGDLETEMQQAFYEQYQGGIPHVDILFQPHHGRKSGSVPDKLLDALDPSLIIIGNAPAEHIDYGDARHTITQNTSGDLVFVLEAGKVHVYSQHAIPNKPIVLQNDLVYALSNMIRFGCTYRGTLTLS